MHDTKDLAIHSYQNTSTYRKGDAPVFKKPISVKDMRLKISSNGRYFTDQKGKPFFYLADTAWALFKRLNHDEIDLYLENRAAKGFNVIQAYVLRGLKVKNLYGDLPLINNDPLKPNEPYFRNVDYIVNRANALGLVMALVVTWGEHVFCKHHDERIFNAENALAFGKFLADRYKNNCVIFYLGGDRDPLGGMPVWAAMAKGLREGGSGNHLISYHGPGSLSEPSSSYWCHNLEWLDFNVLQTGHGWTVENYEFVTHDYNLEPAKPTLDMESSYENHADFRNNTGRRMDAHQVRESLYWEVLAGAAGHGYGCADVRVFYDPELTPKIGDYSFARGVHENTHWTVAMDLPGAACMGFARTLFELRPWYKMVPDQSVIAAGQGTGEDNIQAARADDGSFLLAYLTLGSRVSVFMNKLTGPKVNAQWFNPRDGRFITIGEFTNSGVQEFTPPSSVDRDDWVLVLDDAAKKYRNQLQA